MDLALNVLVKKAKTLELCVKILPLLKNSEEICTLISETNDHLNYVKNDLTVMKQYVDRMKEQNESMRLMIQKLADAHDYIDDIEKNIPNQDDLLYQRLCIPEKNIPNQGDLLNQRLCIPEKVNVTSKPVSTSNKEPFELRYLHYLTDEEFEDLPFYLRGRLNSSELKNFVDAFNQALEKKYNILRTPREKLKTSDREIRDKLRKQVIREAPGLIFCTEDDVKEFYNVKSAIKLRQMVSILRHSQQLKEVRADGLIRFCVASSVYQFEKELKQINAI